MPPFFTRSPPPAPPPKAKPAPVPFHPDDAVRLLHSRAVPWKQAIVARADRREACAYVVGRRDGIRFDRVDERQTYVRGRTHGDQGVGKSVSARGGGMDG